MTTAFVLSGGGSLGAVQVGMLRALAEHGERPDLIVGTSAGAINASFIAGHGTGREALDELDGIWARLRRRDIFPFDPRRHLRALSRGAGSVFPSTGLHRLISTHLPYEQLEHARIPVHVVATNLLTGQEVLLSTGSAVTALLASTAVPGLWPPVRRDGLVLVDGGLADNAAISQAVALGAERIFVLPAGYACALTEAPSGALATALQALGFLTQQRLIHDVVAFAERAELHVIPPLCPLRVSPADFRHARELSERAHRATHDWLENRMDTAPSPERFLSLHDHTSGGRRPALPDSAPTP